MSCERATHFAPYLCAGTSWHNPCDVDACSALALNDVLHEQGQFALLHQVNDSNERKLRLYMMQRPWPLSTL
jgi:hypothetical protein